jgi:aromatic-L-amino-acid decarboxylase
MRAMVAGAMDRIVHHIETLPSQPMHGSAGGRKLARALREPLPEGGVAFERLLRLLFGRVIPTSFNTASPGYLAYIPGGGLFHSAVADLIADATNRYVGVFQAAPGLVALEANVVRWFASIIGLPEGSGGILTTGGSLANFTAVVTARRERLPADFLRGVLYTSEEAHHSVQKAAMLAGFPPERVRKIPSDARFRLDLSALREAIASDRAADLTPFLLVGSAGTTATGAVDALTELADIAEQERLWFHVDAAYGGFFALTERGRVVLRGIERADSVTLDPHKSLFLPYGTGCLLVRDVEALRRAHSVSASYLPTMQTEPGLFDYCELSPELSRDARGLRVWLPLKMHGAAVFRAELDEKLDLARAAAEALRLIAEIEISAEPELSLFAFRWCPPGLDDEAVDALNRRLIAAVNARQRVLLTGAVVHERFVVRICVLSFRTHREHIDMCLSDIAQAMRQLAG